MSVAAASGAVSTQHHQPTQEQIRLAQLIEDKKHDHPEVKEILRKVLDVVVDSKEEDALVALFDCDYDYEKAVALLIEKGHDVASEWRTATNHKLSKKQQQQQKVTAPKNGQGDLDENGHQRGNEGATSRGKSRGGRARMQQNGGDSQHISRNQQQQNENHMPQQRQRGGSGYRGRYRGNHRVAHRGIDRNQYHAPELTNTDTSLPSDTNRRTEGSTGVVSNQQQYPWEIGNWDGQTIIISRTTGEGELPIISNESSEVSTNQSNTTNQETPKPDFDPIEAARQIKNVIGIGQTSKPVVSEQLQKSKTTAPVLNTKVTPPPRIPQQPVIFSDHFDGGVNKIDVQFGNLGETLDDPSSTPSAFYQQSISSNKVSQRTTEQSSHISPSPRPSEQPVMSQQQQQQQPPQQRVLPPQLQQQPTMPIKQVVTPQYAVPQQQHPMTPQNILIQSLLYRPQQTDSVALDTSFDPANFHLSPLDFNSTYFMQAAMSQPPTQQPNQARYMVSQPAPLPQQAPSKNAQSSSVSTATTTAKKAPAIPPGIFPPTAPLNPATYSTAYTVQQQTPGANYSASYDTEHIFGNTFVSLANTQQTQSPSGAYGSMTPPVQQQTNTNNDNKTMNYPASITENLMLLQHLQQTNSQQQVQPTAPHSGAPVNYYISHPGTGPSYSPGPPIMFAQPATTVPQHQQTPKQQTQQYNQNASSMSMGGNDTYYNRNSSTSNKEGQYMYTAASQAPHVQTQSAGQQQNLNKQQRTGGTSYNNQQGQQRPYQ